MTPQQDRKYWREWNRVRRAIGDEATNQLRHDLHARALGHDMSHKDFTNQQFDRVLAEFYSISRPADMDRQLAQLNQQRNRMIWKVNRVQVPLLGVFIENPRGYLAELLHQRFGVDSVEELSHQPGGKDGRGDPGSQLQQLVMTLAARIDAMRRKAGMSVKELYSAAQGATSGPGRYRILRNQWA